MTSFPNGLLSAIPVGLRDELLHEYNKLIKNFRESRWEPAELNGGKLCEIVYTIVEGYTSGSFPAKAQKPNNFYDSCRLFERLDSSKFSRSVRIQIPRVLVFLYEVRNNRGVGHVGGEVSPNFMDANFVVASAKWLLAELIRLFHQVDTVMATAAVEAVTQREIQIVWNVNDKKRVLISGMTAKKSTMLLLYSCLDGSASDDELFEWVEHSNKGVFKRDVLRPLHKSRYVEYDAVKKIVQISPTGIRHVEEDLLKS